MSLTKCIKSDLSTVINLSGKYDQFKRLLGDYHLFSRNYHLKNQKSAEKTNSDHRSTGHYHSSSISRPFSSSEKKQIHGNFRNCILVSQSKNIFENLAIEDWLYRYQNFDDDDSKLLLIWYNTPSIVIGRHQNPWQEINLDQCIRSNVALARRNSGGGTVYHDLNNLNICFFTNKKSYNRKRNLELIQRTIKTSFQIDLTINGKEDLVLDKTNEKVSGTASKLAYNKSYHHCTLLIDSDLNDLSKFIRKRSVGFSLELFQNLFQNYFRIFY